MGLHMIGLGAVLLLAPLDKEAGAGGRTLRQPPLLIFIVFVCVFFPCLLLFFLSN